MVGLFCLKSAAMLSAVSGNFHQSENGLFVQLIDKMSPGDIIVGDRGFCSYVLICLLGQRQVDFIGRCKRKFKKTQGRQRLGRAMTGLFVGSVELPKLLSFQKSNRNKSQKKNNCA